MRGVPADTAHAPDLVLEIVRNGGASAIWHVVDEGDVQRIMRHPRTMIASDGELSSPAGGGHAHPRAYGTFPRVLGLYVREKNILSLEDAVRKMTSMPAERLRLKDRGRIAEGKAADLVVFEAERVIDRATFDDPDQYPAGIPYVLVNGVFAVDGGKATRARAGQVLRREPGRKRR